MTIVFIITYLLNIIDMLFTRYWVTTYGVDAEANPIGRFMYTYGIADVVKMFVVGMLLIVLYKIGQKDNKIAYYGMVICMIVYIVVLYMHLVLWIEVKTI